MILKARAVALPYQHEQGSHKKQDVEDLPGAGEGPQDDERDPSMAAPLPALVDEGLSEELLWKVVKACNSGGYNILLILLRIRASLSEVACFPELETYTQVLINDLLDKCKTKEQAQAMLSPITDDPTVKDWPQSIPTDPMMLALEQGNKQFIAHKHVQALLVDKFDPMGSYEYSSKPSTVLFWAVSALLIYMWWAITFTWLLVLRPFSNFLIRFSEKGSKKNVDTRFPWHLPYNKWLASYMTLLIMTTLLSNLVLHSSPAHHSLKAEEIVLIVWAVGTLMDKALEGLYACLASGLHLLDITSALFYVGFFVARVSYITQQEEVHVPPLGVVTRASDMLAVSVCCSVLRLLGVFVISPSFGPLLVMIKRMLLVDFAKFFTILVVDFIAFGLAMVSLFKPLCVDGACEAYDLYWDYSWQNDGLGGAIVHLLFQLFGVGSSQEAWAQKPVTGAIFFIIFIVIVGLLLLNLLIAMFSASYTTVLETSDQEYKFNRALVIREFGAREAIYPPLNLLHLVFGFIGNSLRKAVFHGDKGLKTVKLVQTSNRSSKFFAWYFPEGADEKWFLQCRSILFQKFILAKDSGH
ncbi:hypothetical protein DUNSADRAFT_14617 [Dunaliella salina]|nr:hypothetical protein DUNSADRAFT_14617 [Dunaliella salina]|eukprot:KAF5841059.1 hypothetical protein DUNSADRAFT_14617 [Dunaliella salina]